MAVPIWFAFVMCVLIAGACAMLIPDTVVVAVSTLTAFLHTEWQAFAKHWPRLSQQLATWGWAGLLVAALAFEEAREYGVALILVCAAAVSLVATCIHWQGLPDDPKTTKSVRFLGVIFALLIITIGPLWVWGNKGSDEKWSRLPAAWHKLMMTRNKRVRGLPEEEKRITPTQQTTLGATAAEPVAAPAASAPKTMHGSHPNTSNANREQAQLECRDDKLANCSPSELHDRVLALASSIQKLVDDCDDRRIKRFEAEKDAKSIYTPEQYQQWVKESQNALIFFQRTNLDMYNTNYRDMAIKYRDELVQRLGLSAKGNAHYDPGGCMFLLDVVEDLSRLVKLLLTKETPNAQYPANLKFLSPRQSL